MDPFNMVAIRRAVAEVGDEAATATRRGPWSERLVAGGARGSERRCSYEGIYTNLHRNSPIEQITLQTSK